MANLSVLSPGKWILDIFGKNMFQPIFNIFCSFDIFPKNKIRTLDPCSTRVDLSRSPDCTWAFGEHRMNANEQQSGTKRKQAAGKRDEDADASSSLTGRKVTP